MQFIKAPGEKLDYSINWLAWLNGDTISSPAWTCDLGITVVDQSYDTTSTTLWLSGGTVRTSYNCKNTVTTSGSRIGVRSITINVQDK